MGKLWWMDFCVCVAMLFRLSMVADQPVTNGTVLLGVIAILSGVGLSMRHSR